MLNFIKRERIYIWMLFFILIINVIGLAAARHKKVYEENSFSTKALGDIKFTEEHIKGFLESKKPAAIFFKYALISAFCAFVSAFILNLSIFFRKGAVFNRIETNNRAVSWGILDIFRVAIIVIFIGYLISIVEGSILKAFHFNLDFKLRGMLDTFFIDIIAGFLILYFTVVKYKEKLISLGLSLSNFYRNILAGITAYIAILPVLLLALFLSVSFLDILGYKAPPQPVLDLFFEEKRSGVILFLTIFVSVFGPIIEEMFFRGFMYSAVKRRFGVLAGVFFTAAIFSILHANLVGFVPIMILGILLAYLYETTGSLIASMTVHILHNSIMLGFVFFIKEALI